MKDFHKHYMDYPKVYMEMKKKKKKKKQVISGYALFAKKKKNQSVIESNKSLDWTRFHWVPTVCI